MLRHILDTLQPRSYGARDLLGRFGASQTFFRARSFDHCLRLWALAFQVEAPYKPARNRVTRREPMAKLEDGTDEAALKARLETLSAALDARKKSQGDSAARDESAAEAGGSRGRAMSAGARVLSEFVAGILVGGFIGWELDNFFGTSPALFVVFLILGLMTGFYNVYRIGRASETTPPKA